MNAPTLAIVDDDHDFGLFLASIAKRRGFQTQQFHTVAEACPWLNRNDAELTMLDMALPDGTGFDVLKSRPPEHRGRIVFVSGTGDADEIRRAVASPADEFLGKPLEEGAIDRLLSQAHARFSSRMKGQLDHGRLLIGESAAMMQVREDIGRVAPTRLSVLIAGETGTGKEMVARAIHQESGRRGRMVSVNCGAVPADLLASQLFGHERGAFTGANSRHRGYFEQAEGGTLFLDEIGEMPAALQVYLLRALETGSIVRVGGTEEVALDVRIIAATHRIQTGEPGPLRDDLYYRLARFPIEIPPLRARGADIELLANSFVHALNREYEEDRRLDPACLPRLLAYAWPGNVRELMSATERAYLRSPNSLVHVTPIGCREHSAIEADRICFRPGMTFRQMEDEMLRHTLAYHRGDKTAAAKSLGVSVRTIHNHLARLRSHG
ncbi:sigma-54-dependent Fis family transcriptional regulator [Pseudoxanthomonas helianthi]|uniref:Sigma-54-dependent Fis family transcriptional regulator n=1 Tax=Pseudoxanthomonas helianthi TaxID=1453541 RepID=A0A940X326_9GAMM|nr:sigma-54 dependent transcriptional regulator [Pseudoxanthomonas helianthi]MBP3983383.1 sigma-54-dependent Fis family transcriptional regulator [Pseudoxanthomonas helianthi]